jgi:helicase
MVSYHYAKNMKVTERPRVPLFIDSGGFASLFKGSEMLKMGKYVSIHTKEGDVVDPAEVLRFQMDKADIGATVDFIIPPGMVDKEARRRQQATICNALWAIKQPRREGFRLYASVQAWDAISAKRIMKKLTQHPFDGFALGGMVPRVRDPEKILEIVRAIREVEPYRPLHVFGIGQPALVKRLFREGVDSTDSSSYLKQAAGRKWLSPTTRTYQKVEISEICRCMICSTLGKKYLELDGELNTMALALHNLLSLTES